MKQKGYGINKQNWSDPLSDIRSMKEMRSNDASVT